MKAEYSTRKIAVIGAGITGVSCAHRLALDGFRPTIFEKSRGLGGRLATRRLEGGLSMDHGAQYVTARSELFKDAVAGSVVAGAAAVWHPKVDESAIAGSDQWIVGAPGMNALVKPLAGGIDTRFTDTVSAIERESAGWRVRTTNDAVGQIFDVVVCTAPPPQTRSLLASHHDFGEQLAGVAIAPCWALMMVFPKPLDIAFEVALPKGGAIAWMARNSSKPSRTEGKEAWVVHASPEWSEKHLECEKESVADMLLAEFRAAAGSTLPEIETLVAHRWRYALTTKPLGKPFLRSVDSTLFAGGDWCLGARVECGFESGRAIADAIVGGP
tara:strand:+ start:8629 stop:9612 length:984 start_codon:yes stop_codon:yes gene_type:complete